MKGHKSLDSLETKTNYAVYLLNSFTYTNNICLHSSCEENPNNIEDSDKKLTPLPPPEP
jgi:hypothetical protein